MLAVVRGMHYILNNAPTVESWLVPRWHGRCEVRLELSRSIPSSQSVFRRDRSPGLRVAFWRIRVSTQVALEER
jgi:hypothetical protein